MEGRPVEPSREIEAQIESASTLDDSASTLASLLAGGYHVGTGGRLCKKRRRSAGRIGVTVVMRPNVLPTPHAHIVATGLEAVMSVTDGKLLAGSLTLGERKLVAWWWMRNQRMLVTAWERAAAVDDSLRNLRHALRSLPWTPTDQALYDRLAASEHVTNIVAFLSAARTGGPSGSPGMWAVCISLLISDWQRSGAASSGVEGLTALLQQFPVSPDPQAASLVGLIVDSLSLLHWEVTGAVDDDRDAVAGVLTKLADLLVQLDQAGLAANLALDAATLGRPGSPATEAAARMAVERANAVPNPAQATAGLVVLAGEIAAACMSDATRRVEAFDAAEHAIEALAATALPHRSEYAGLLVRNLRGHAGLEPLRHVAAQFMGSGEPDPRRWQPRVQHMERSAWINRIRSMYETDGVWFAIDDARASLHAVPASVHASADWTHWTVDHPAYRRVIPHRRSFLREQAFAHNLLVLTHEVTHVLSFLGGVGLALACLRTAAFAKELALWREQVAAEVLPLSQMARHGFAPLPAGYTAALPDVVHTLEMHRKSQSLQDVWAPWFEGLAVFGETSANPMHEASVVDPVNGALANLVDAAVDVDHDPEARPKTVGETLSAILDEFQQRSAAAVQQHGADRLSRYLRETGSPYWIGYLTVRSVVSNWRSTVGRRISGTQAFRLLLHATRYDTEDVIPDLGLDVPAFARTAKDKMLAWVRRLAGLSAADIDLLIRSQDSAVGVESLKWVRGRPVPAYGRSGDEPDGVAARLRTRVAESLAGSAEAEDIEALAQHANQTILLGSFLPIGRCDALFHLGIDPSDGSGHLIVLLRTTDSHVDGGSSMNLFGTTLEPDSAATLAEQATRTGRARIEVTRIIDLGGLASPEVGVSGLHFLAFHLGGWFELRGATNGVETILRAKPGRAEQLRELVRARLLPTSLMRVERKLIAVPEFAAVRAIEWLRASSHWDAPRRPPDFPRPWPPQIPPPEHADVTR